MTGKADGRRMFMEQKYRVEGDLELIEKTAVPGKIERNLEHIFNTSRF